MIFLRFRPLFAVSSRCGWKLLIVGRVLFSPFSSAPSLCSFSLQMVRDRAENVPASGISCFLLEFFAYLTRV
ncbi:hypothetical protein BDW42DRAFT_181371 [Aspergillus taichungensis]|uniref:Uncharacterized protein n=1 Tax=Aspergillus taichungensis TaxID=482145 RepID=A0A2J5HDY8_9EURO|nr:hypothetical protein BDW42DRAFT_181371 [Aspergillus taichungensis]